MTPNTVFISYRRTSQYTALAVFKALREQGFDVFFDYESIDTGSFEQIIMRQIAARAHFVLVLAPGALDRCTDPQDMVRKEIEEAIRLKRNIVPLLFDGFDMSKIPANLLPGRMTMLPSYNSLPIPRELIYFDHAMHILQDRFLSKSLEGILHPIPPEDASEIQHKIEIAENLPNPTEKQLMAEEHNRRGNQFSRAGDYNSAIAAYTEAIKLNPIEVIYLTNRATVRSRKGDYDGAIADASEALRLNASYEAAHIELGFARISKGDYDGAIRDANDLLKLDPQFAMPYRNRGIAQHNRGDYAAANADFQCYIDLGGADADKVRGWIRNNEEKLRKRQ